MQLWTDYEGVTIDGVFPLHKLLLPEGRSAFFSTAGPKGEPTLVRLIECHFDEEEILARWRCVEALNHPNFLKFEHYGQIELDGGSVVYAVVEKVDANLAAVLGEGHLSVKDVAKLASSLVAALDALHTDGFIHEHIEPRNIFAVGEVVKLRCDCIRETPEGEEGRAVKQRDVRDLATVLLQALTERQSLEYIPGYAVPPPFHQVIRNGLEGTWGLDEIRAALEGKSVSTPRAVPKSAAHAAPATPAMIEQKARSAAARPSIWQEPQLTHPPVDENRKAEFARGTTRKGPRGEEQSFSVRSRWLGALGTVAALLLLSAWVLGHGWNVHREKAMQPIAAVSQPAVQSAKQTSTSSATSPVNAASPRASLLPSPGSRGDWRVIAFTYNRRADAEKKAASLAATHPELQPAVFVPTGHVPYLVSIGGLMDREAAYALARRARSLGLPHDTYAQNYSR